MYVCILVEQTEFIVEITLQSFSIDIETDGHVFMKLSSQLQMQAYSCEFNDFKFGLV